MPNRLARETSAYLRQHMHNPVDWYAWGEEAFERAKAEKRPVLVSIGYSSCHWCHVMERESFEDPEVAALMNESFVSIKVDREERPDVDQIYMETVVRLTGSGGWPLNVFCTPDGRPFFGGTYYPPQRAHGRPSWRDVLLAVLRTFREQPEAVEEQATRILELLRTRPESAVRTRVGLTAGDEPPSGGRLLTELCKTLMRRADAVHGGFGGAPKFPTPTNLEALLLAEDRGAAIPGSFEHVRLTLTRMARGGIFDQLGGGFHRYSVDARWAVPHFEKMLYDQGQLLRVYAAAHRRSGDANLAWPVEETIAFLEREMRSPEGGFFASLDADSEGEEGRYYVWTPAKVEAVLGAEAGAAFSAAYGVGVPGNFEGGAQSVLAHGLAGERPRFAREREALREARAKRVRPETDPKQITAWVAYAIGGLATAASAFARPAWRTAAERAAAFVEQRLIDAEGRLLRIWDGERARIPGFLDDYAAWMNALLDLHRAGGDERWIGHAVGAAEIVCARFFDADRAELLFAADDAEALVVRPGSDADGATPAAGGLATLGLVRLAELTGREDLRRIAERVLQGSAGLLTAHPAELPTLVRAGALLEGGLGLALVIGAPDDLRTGALAQRARHLLGPEDAVVVMPTGSPPRWLDPAWTEGREAPPGRPTAWLCRGRVCSLPASAPDELELPPREASQ